MLPKSAVMDSGAAPGVGGTPPAAAAVPAADEVVAGSVGDAEMSTVE